MPEATVEKTSAPAPLTARKACGGAVRSTRVTTPGVAQTVVPLRRPVSCRWKWPHKMATTSVPSTTAASSSRLRRPASTIQGAVGVWIDTLPITPEKILKALEEKRRRETPNGAGR